MFDSVCFNFLMKSEYFNLNDEYLIQAQYFIAIIFSDICFTKGPKIPISNLTKFLASFHYLRLKMIEQNSFKVNSHASA